ncbi:hypothetical protein Vadar_018717 [Vaccinium darrowii]|uniref:Uncharacterized protein n=1 Tax=Vaccinium darrowii TaxID=229202 RepID=A0ACB7YNF1_9ERIC|nr:hypothetical protein Vadar_018717 [Vaccinium darrowii]
MPPLEKVNFTSLAVLDLYGNEFNVLMSRWIFSLGSPFSLNLAVSKFEGPIPSGLQNLTSLTELDLSQNFYFKSSIPNWLYSFRYLELFDLSRTQLHGTISSSVENLTSLVSLDLGYTKLRGSLPREVENLCNLRELHLTDQLELFKSLKDLDLSRNSLSGPIPDSIKETQEGYKLSDLASQCMHRYKIYIEGSACHLMPVHHYWPIKEGDKCRSIKFAVEWGNSRKQKAQDIGKAASDFNQQDLKMDQVYEYMFHLLCYYA